MSRGLGDVYKRQSVYSLGFRVTMAALLLILVSYGLYTGELGNNVPWGS